MRTGSLSVLTRKPEGTHRRTHCPTARMTSPMEDHGAPELATRTSLPQSGAVSRCANVVQISYQSANCWRASLQYQSAPELLAAKSLPGPRIPKDVLRRWVSNSCSPTLPRLPGSRERLVTQHDDRRTPAGSCGPEFSSSLATPSAIREQASPVPRQEASEPAKASPLNTR